MRGPKPPPIVLTAAQRDTLQRLARRQRSPQQPVRRVRIMLEAASGVNDARIARLLGIDRGQVRTWRKRWLEAAPRLITAEEEAKEKKEAGDDESSSSSSSNNDDVLLLLLTEVIEEVLADEPRSGTPPTPSARSRWSG